MPKAQAQPAERYVSQSLDTVSARLRDEKFQKMFEDIVEAAQILSADDRKALDAQIQGAIAQQLGLPVATETADKAAVVLQQPSPAALANVDEFCEMLFEMDDYIEMMGKRIERMVEVMGKFKSIRGGIKGGVALQMESWNLRKVNGREHYFLLKKNPRSVEIDDERSVPAEFVEYEPKVSKTAIRQALEAGQEVPGCRFKDDTSHLEVK